ncbi:MAG: NUDIX domain-containing protein [Candidatus Daviesbacteria bacterium]|nr:NUDIX domain-containing protein [Candidatus Daviesbacteria bacterium]
MKTILAKLWRALSMPRGIQLLLMRVFQDQFLIGVTGIIFNESNEVLLFKHTYRQTAWSLPGGYIKSKEHPFEALEREILEESGLVVSAEEQLKIRTDRETSRLDVTVVGQHIGGEFKKSPEVTEFGFFSFENLPFISKRQLLLIEYALHNKTPQVVT